MALNELTCSVVLLSGLVGCAPPPQDTAGPNGHGRRMKDDSDLNPGATEILERLLRDQDGDGVTGGPRLEPGQAETLSRLLRDAAPHALTVNPRLIKPSDHAIILAEGYAALGDIERAILATRLIGDRRRAVGVRHVAEMLGCMGDLAAARRVITLADGAGYAKYQQFLAYCRLADIQIRTGDFAGAGEDLRLAAGVVQGMDASGVHGSWSSAYLQQIGLLYGEIDEPEAAVRLADRMVAEAKTQTDGFYRILKLEHASRIYAQMGRGEAAWRIIDSVDGEVGRSGVWVEMATGFLAAGNLREAERVAQTATRTSTRARVAVLIAEYHAVGRDAFAVRRMPVGLVVLRAARFVGREDPPKPRGRSDPARSAPAGVRQWLSEAEGATLRQAETDLPYAIRSLTDIAESWALAGEHAEAERVYKTIQRLLADLPEAIDPELETDLFGPFGKAAIAAAKRGYTETARSMFAVLRQRAEGPSTLWGREVALAGLLDYQVDAGFCNDALETFEALGGLSSEATGLAKIIDCLAHEKNEGGLDELLRHIHSESRAKMAYGRLATVYIQMGNTKEAEEALVRRFGRIEEWPAYYVPRLAEAKFRVEGADAAIHWSYAIEEPERRAAALLAVVSGIVESAGTTEPAGESRD